MRPCSSSLLIALLGLTLGCQSPRSTNVQDEPTALDGPGKSRYYSLRSRALGGRKTFTTTTLVQLLEMENKSPEIVQALVNWDSFSDWSRSNDGLSEEGSEDALIRVVDPYDPKISAFIAIHQVEWQVYKKIFLGLKNQSILATLYISPRSGRSVGRLVDTLLVKLGKGSQNGQREGQWEFRNIVGALVEKGHYEEGERSGPWTFYWSNGQKRRSGSYLKGQLNGPWTYYYSNGAKLAKSGSYINGLKSGTWISYFENGQKEQALSYELGILEGASQRFWTNGKKRESGQYLAGQSSRQWQFWYLNGQKEQEGTFVDGEKDGLWTFWSKEGKILEESAWDKGRLIRQK
jgi:antitoxin component YwqK of YwqJK toxin-antitoxin module